MQPKKKINAHCSQYRFFLNEISNAAERYALSKGISHSEFEDDVLSQAIDFFDELRWAFSSDDDDSEDIQKRRTFWVHDRNLLRQRDLQNSKPKRILIPQNWGRRFSAGGALARLSILNLFKFA